MILLLSRTIFAFAGTLGFTILFHAPKKEIFFCGITGSIGWFVFDMLSLHGMGLFAATVCGATVLTLLARILAVLRLQPVTVYLLTGIFPLVPGSGIYYTAYYVMNHMQEEALSKGAETIGIAASISFGILLAFSIPQSWISSLVHRKGIS